MRRIASIGFGLAAVSFGVLSTLGCESPFESRTLIIGIENDIVTLDPHRIADVFSLRVASTLYDGLVELDSSNRIVPALAESWSVSQDSREWIFLLRRNARFEGPAVTGGSRPLSPEDVRVSIARMLGPGTATAPALRGVEGADAVAEGKADLPAGVTTVDSHSVRIRLSKPDPYFLARLTSPSFAIVPAELGLATDAVNTDLPPAGTGTFGFEGRSGSDIVFRRKTVNWRKDAGNVRRLVFRVVSDDAIRLAEFKNGRLDVAYISPGQSSSVILQSNGYNRYIFAPDLASDSEALIYPTFNSYFLAFNTRNVDKPLRQAVSLAVDRPRLVSTILPLAAKPASGPVPLAMNGWRASRPATLTDIRKAASLLRQSRFNTAKDRLEVLVHEKASSEPVGEFIQSELQGVGIKTALVKLSFGAVVDRVLKGNYQATILGFEYNFSTPALILANHFHSSAIPMPNLFFFSDPAVDSAIASLEMEGVPERSLAAARLLEGQIVDAAPAAFLFQTQQVVLKRRIVAELSFNAHNIPLLAGVRLP